VFKSRVEKGLAAATGKREEEEEEVAATLCNMALVSHVKKRGQE
jgi:hypothetical protein